jgi:uncharacterized protein
MIVPDVNLLIYAHNSAAPLHEAAREWWEGSVTREQPVGLAWAVVMGFIRLVTHASVLVDPLHPTRATEIAASWLSLPSVRILEPGPRHLTILRDLFEAVGVAGALTTDAHLAALAIEHQAEVHSNDHDFTRFPGLRYVNPLA